MRPLKLEMAAFGPFPGSETIDFSALGDSPLFLINGPTGSGKTTILDAVCFALYGKTTGNEREGAQMRCDLAPSDRLCEVSLEFKLHDRHFLIRRVPEQMRPKARGDGLTEQKPEAQLSELFVDGGKKLMVASKVSEATREIESLTGLSVDQFRQVMVLPQGQFRQLLLAESSEREKIFSQLFQTGLYKRLEDRLKEQSADIRRERDACSQQRQGLFDSAEVLSTEELETEVSELTGKVSSALQHRKEKEEELLSAHQKMNSARSLVEEFRRFNQVEDELRILSAGQEDIDQERCRLSAAVAAQGLRSFFRERDRCQGETERTRQRLADCSAALTKLRRAVEDSEEALKKSTEISHDIERLKSQLRELDTYQKQAVQLTVVQEKINEVQKGIKSLEMSIELRTLQGQAKLFRDFEIQDKLYLDLSDKLREEEKQGLRHKQAYEQATRDNKTLELAWHRGQASLLAAELEAGVPCPVCGGTDHPAPASVHQNQPDFRTLEKSRQALNDSFNTLAAARDRFRELRSEVARVKGIRDELAEACKENNSVSPNDINARISEIEKHLSRFTIHNSERGIELTDAELTAILSGEKEILAGLIREKDMLEADLPENLRSAEAIACQIKRIQERIVSGEKEVRQINETHQKNRENAEAAKASYLEVEQALKNSEKQLNAAREECSVELAASSFQDEDEYRKAVLDEDALKALQLKITEFDRKRQALQGALEQLRKSLTDRQMPDITEYQNRVDQAAAEKQRADQAWQTLDNRLQVLMKTRIKLEKNREQLRELDERYAVIGTLSDVASGQTGQKISLQRFVLSVLLDDVLAEASQRLENMSKSRYRLLRKEDRAKGNKASGLELLVDDAYTGKVRPVATLSGGESFMAALALALGLSDIVQAYAGGVRLDTLFVDEGFGSLDPESLDLAIRTLVDLQSGGRMIGIISHVAELKEQIPLRIDIQQKRSGSSIAMQARL